MQDRRSVLKVLFAAGVATISGLMAWGAARFVSSASGVAMREVIAPETLNLVQAGAPFHAAASGVWLQKGNDGAIKALDDRCTHLGCRFKWNPTLGQFECPCHGSRFDTSGKALIGPADKPIPTLSLEKTSQGAFRVVSRS